MVSGHSWLQLKNGWFYVKVIVGEMDRTPLYHLLDYEGQKTTNLQDRIISKTDFKKLQI